MVDRIKLHDAMFQRPEGFSIIVVRSFRKSFRECCGVEMVFTSVRTNVSANVEETEWDKFGRKAHIRVEETNSRKTMEREEPSI